MIVLSRNSIHWVISESNLFGSIQTEIQSLWAKMHIHILFNISLKIKDTIPKLDNIISSIDFTPYGLNYIFQTLLFFQK